MTQHTIDLFMWGYQEHFRVDLEGFTTRTLDVLGVEVKPKVLLVGVRRPEYDSCHPICVEPENGQWALEIFDNLTSNIADAIPHHPLNDMFYSDKASMREKPERIRKSVIQDQIKLALAQFDTKHKVQSFVGAPTVVDQYHVVSVIQIPERAFDLFPTLHRVSESEYQPSASLFHSVICQVHEEATTELRGKDPGRSMRNSKRTEQEVIRRAATAFLRTPGALLDLPGAYADMYKIFNELSALRYERNHGVGKILMINPDNPAIEFAVRFRETVPLKATRWARKVLEMATEGLSVIADCEKIHGLGRLKPDHNAEQEDAFSIDFVGHYQWSLACGSRILMRSRYGEPRLPQERIQKGRFIDNVHLIFGDDSAVDANAVWQVFHSLLQQDHGCMVVIGADASTEAIRLAGQGTAIYPEKLDTDLLRSASRIDGTILVDPSSICHAVGIILDGAASNDCLPSRGSRYNSAVRYVGSSESARMAIVVSDDRTFDIVPLLNERIDPKDIENALKTFENTTTDNYHASRLFLDDHRFYLTQEQCNRANSALDRLAGLPWEVGQIHITTRGFEANPEMNDRYYLKSSREKS